jgi:hypothetical protein
MVATQAMAKEELGVRHAQMLSICDVLHKSSCARKTVFARAKQVRFWLLPAMITAHPSEKPDVGF